MALVSGVYTIEQAVCIIKHAKQNKHAKSYSVQFFVTHEDNFAMQFSIKHAFKTMTLTFTGIASNHEHIYSHFPN